MTTLYTYFGDFLLGLFVEWTIGGVDSGSVGTTYTHITLTQNLRSKLHVYGLGSNTSGEVPNMTYEDTTPMVADYDPDDATVNPEFTQNNNVFIGYVGTGTTNTDLTTRPTVSFPVDATNAIETR